MKKIAVVREWINRSTLYTLKDHSNEMTDHEVFENEDLPNDYWAVVKLDEDGFCVETLADAFNSADEAWAYYDKYKQEHQ